MSAPRERPSWWRPAWAMPGGFFCGWRVGCRKHGALLRLCMASDLTQLRERAS